LSSRTATGSHNTRTPGRQRRWYKAVIKGGCGDSPLIAENHVAHNEMAPFKMAVISGGRRRTAARRGQAGLF
jgi:hypothetical protein